MNKEIILPESVEEGTDLFDGLIIEAYQNNTDLSDMDVSALSSIYARLLHYADVMKYIDKPLEDYNKYEEAVRLSEKLGVNIDEARFRRKAEECELRLAR